MALGLAVLLLATGVGAGRAEAGTLGDVRARGYVHCGVTQGLAGFSNPDDKGKWTGIDVDLCRAVAAAIFGDAEKVRYTPLSAKERFTALQSGEVDILARTTTWTFSRDVSLGINFLATNYYDGQGFMVPKALGVASAHELDGATFCTNTGTTTELNLADFARANGITYTLVTFEKNDEAVAAYAAGRCDVLTTDQSGLHANRLKLRDPGTHMVLPEVISKEPLAIAVRQGDPEWANVVRWSFYVTLAAEELGVTSSNLDEMRASTNPEVRRLLGLEGTIGADIGLSNDWAAAIIRQVGNYGESFERHLGKGSPLGIERGLNALWRDGGLQYAPPIR